MKIRLLNLLLRKLFGEYDLSVGKLVPYDCPELDRFTYPVLN